MITRDEARRIAIRYVEVQALQSGIDLVLVDEHTIERDIGWMFFYNSKKYLETGDFRFSLGGNAPLIVDRRNGSQHVTGTAYDPEDYFLAYEALGPERFHTADLADFMRKLVQKPFGS